MADGNLLFKGPPATDGNLVFGADDGAATGDSTILLVGSMGDFGGTVLFGAGQSIRLLGSLGAFGGEMSVQYSSQVQRPIVGGFVDHAQYALHAEVDVVDTARDGARMRIENTVRWQSALALRVQLDARFQASRRAGRHLDARYQRALRADAGFTERFQDARRSGIERVDRYQQALRAGREFVARFQEAIRLRQVVDDRYQQALPAGKTLDVRARLGLPAGRTLDARYQRAIRAPAGIWVRPPVIPEDPCYVPNGHLVFTQPWSADGSLVFIFERHVPPPEPGATVVVPVRRIYTVINTAQLRRVDGDVLIPNLSMALTIDADSWTWGFTASVPGSALPDLEPTGGVPVELEARINSVAYRAIVESISRERVFGSAMLSVSGRGKAAVLDAPYSPIMTFDNAGADRTVQQLANDVLTINGVPLGWDIDAGWKPDDWLVPAGAWSHQGTYISALNAIAGAAGAYVQPHATAQALSVLKRYPAMPWEWSEVVPDYELPSAVVQKEGIVWTDKPIYNRVVVRGMKHGRQVVATRLGTAGEIEAPMVTDQLITNAIGGRQRAIPVLADVGRQAALSLRLPVLPETGIIPPGKFVRFVDGGVTRIGLVRSTDATAVRAEEKLTIWQTIGVETHVGL